MVAKEFDLSHGKDIIYVCPEFLRWPDKTNNLINTQDDSIHLAGDTYVQAGCVHRQYLARYSTWAYGMPMTYFVKMSEVQS